MIFNNKGIYIHYQYAVIFDVEKLNDDELRKYRTGASRYATGDEIEKYKKRENGEEVVVKCKDVGIQVRNKKFYETDFEKIVIDNYSLFKQLATLKIKLEIDSLENLIYYLVDFYQQNAELEENKRLKKRIKTIENLIESLCQKRIDTNISEIRELNEFKNLLKF